MRTTSSAALVSTLWPARKSADWIRQVALVVGGSLLLAASAHVTVPMWPVPMTMQTFAVLLLGATFGFRLGALAVIAYLIEGAVGLPFITAPLGGPTTGYLIGFLIAASLAGFAADRGWMRSIPGAIAVLLVADALIFAAGMSWLRAYYIPSWEVTAAKGLVPFLLGDAVKIGLAAALLPAIGSLSRKG